MPAALTALLAALGPWIMRFFAAKAVIMVAGFLGRLGLVLVTNEFVIEPLIDATITQWNSMPASIQCWLRAAGVAEAASIIVSGLTLIAGKRVFLGKSS